MGEGIMSGKPWFVYRVSGLIEWNGFWSFLGACGLTGSQEGHVGPVATGLCCQALELWPTSSHPPSID